MDTNTNISDDYNQKENVKNFDKENEPMEASVNKTETVLSKEQFKEFCTFITIIKPYFEDFSIQDGIFRTRSNDSAVIVETEFDCFKNMNLTIFGTKEFVKKLSTLDKKVDINVILDEEHIVFQDEYQSLQVPNNYELIEGKILNNEEMESIFQEDSESSIPFIKERLPKSIVCNVNKTVSSFSTGSISIKHDQNDLSKGHLYISSWNNENGHYTINLKESFLTPMKEDHSLKFIMYPFTFNKSEMDIYFWIVKEEILSLKFSTKIDSLLVNIYGRAAFMGN